MHQIGVKITCTLKLNSRCLTLKNYAFNMETSRYNTLVLTVLEADTPLIETMRFLLNSPYLSADMRRMAVAFNTTVPSLEDELMHLILDGQIQARIDSHNKVNSVINVGPTHRSHSCVNEFFCLR